MQLLMRPDYPTRVTRTLPEAAQWLLLQTQRDTLRPADPGELVVAVEQFRAGL
jgi:hypothetical protein